MGMGTQRWMNSDLYKVAKGLGTTETDPEPVPYLAQIRDNMELTPSRIPLANRLTHTINITTVEEFTTALEEWWVANADTVNFIISTEFLEDSNGTKFYLITYA